MSSYARSSDVRKWGRALGLLALSSAVGACARFAPLSDNTYIAAPPCSTSAVTIAFDFEGASQSHCVIEGERAFRIVVTPEHAPPINPSPWYAFRYEAKPGVDVAITLDYPVGRHRYPPKVITESAANVFAVDEGNGGKSALFHLRAGTGIVSGQELFDGTRYAEFYDRMEQSKHVSRQTLGRSLDGNPIVGLRMGNPAAPHLIVLLGRAHPPEVSGAVAMEAFLEELVAIYDTSKIDPAKYQVLAVPLLNPDGVMRGHWRANLGGKDLNRDWGSFSQPETRAIATWLEKLDPAVRPAVMIDFHSTRSNLFYVQGANETDAVQEAFLKDWLGRNKDRIEDYAFDIERRNANPGSGTSKNWFHTQFGIPAYTLEVGDETDRNATSVASRIFARTMLPALDKMLKKTRR